MHIYFIPEAMKEKETQSLLFVVDWYIKCIPLTYMVYVSQFAEAPVALSRPESQPFPALMVGRGLAKS